MRAEIEQTRDFLDEIADTMEQLATDSRIRTNEDPRGLTGKGNVTNENTLIQYQLLE